VVIVIKIVIGIETEIEIEIAVETINMMVIGGVMTTDDGAMIVGEMTGDEMKTDREIGVMIGEEVGAGVKIEGAMMNGAVVPETEVAIERNHLRH